MFLFFLKALLVFNLTTADTVPEPEGRVPRPFPTEPEK